MKDSHGLVRSKRLIDDGRKEVTRQFIDEKTFKPGLCAHDLKQTGK